MSDLIPRVVSLHRVRALPILGILFAGVFGTVVLAYVLAIGVRTRMRDLAVLRALGLPVRRLTSILTWQALMLATAMLVIGLPIGVLIGSVVWRSLGGDFGVATEPVAPPLLAILLPAVLLVAIVATLAPARRARRQQVAALLRVE